MPETGRSCLAVVPLVMAYVTYPLSMTVARQAEWALPRNWIDGFWLLWGLGCMFVVLARSHGGPRFSHARTLLMLLLALALLLRFGPIWFQEGPELAAWLMELKPFFYLALAVLAIAAGGTPASKHFLHAAAALAVLILLDFALSSLAAEAVVRPQGSGEINYDAALMLAGLCMGLTQRAPALKALVLAGILASMSRTTLLATGLVVLTCWPGLSFPRRFVLSVALLAGIILAFSLRGLSGDGLSELDRYWMWSAGVDLLRDQPLQALIGFAPGRPLPVDVPAALWELWRDQARQTGAPGVHAYNFHSFWLRLAVSWGLTTMLAVLALFLNLLRRSTQARGLGLLLLVQGLTMGLFYLSNVAPVLLLALAESCRSGPVLAWNDGTGRHGPAVKSQGCHACRGCRRAGPGEDGKGMQGVIA
ncbi:MAG: O-antigen ligase [Desulfocurvibacter africanus]